VLLGALALAAGCSSPTAPLVLSGITMGTTWEVKIADAPLPRPPEELQRGIGAVLDGIDASMSTYRADSAISRLNAAAADAWIELPADLHDILRTARALSEQTGGSFDATVGPVVNLWGFGPDRRPRRVPTDAELAAALSRSGYLKLEIDAAAPRVRKLVAELFVDLNAIAPGYAVDRIAAYLAEAGCGNFLVELGGEIHARGPGRDGTGWRIGIERPFTGARGVERVVALRDAGLSTSGDYRDFFEQDGVRYGHTIDPATGRPVTHGLVSVSVVDASTVRADALATALLVLGPERGLAFAERAGIPALLIMQSGGAFEELATPGMRALLTE
jgi:thiamine biosynthesis lipoprotein